MAGAGIAGGKAVAGNVGAYECFEYTVIGDRVNAATRLTFWRSHVSDACWRRPPPSKLPETASAVTGY